MCGIVGILGTGPVAPLLVDALKRLEYRGYDSAGIATLEGGHLERLTRRGQAPAPRGEARPRVARRPLGHRSHALGDARRADRAERAPARDRRGVALVHNGIIENYRELKNELHRRGCPLRLRDRHRSDRPADRPQPRQGHEPRGCGQGDARAADRGLRHRRAVRGRGRSDDRCPPRQPARHRPRQRRDVLRVGRDRPRAVHRPRHLSRGRRLGGAHPQGRDDLRRARQPGRAADDAGAGHQLPGRPRQPPPFHGEGDSRTARSRRAYARQLSRFRRRPDAHRHRSRVSISRASTGSRSPPAAPPTMPASSANTGSSDLPDCRSTSISRPSFAIASSRSAQTGCRSWSRSPARRRTRSPRFAMQSRQGRRSRRSSTSASRRSRARRIIVLPTLAGPEIGVASTKAFTCQLGDARIARRRRRHGRAARSPRTTSGTSSGRSAKCRVS